MFGLLPSVVSHALSYALQSEGTFPAADLSTSAGAIGIGAERAVVLVGVSAWSAVGYGWSLLRAKLRDMLAIAVTLAAILIPVVILLACAILPIIGSTITPAGIQAGRVDDLMYGPTGLALVLFNIALSTILTVFISVVYTLAYRHWQETHPAAVWRSRCPSLAGCAAKVLASPL